MNYSLEEELVDRLFEGIKKSIFPSEENNYKSKFLQSKLLLYCVVLLLVMKIATTLISLNIPKNIFFADITRTSLENFVNQTRQSAGLKALTENPKLNQAAQLKAQNMVQNQYFNHTSPNGITPWFWFSKAGYNYKYAGENLAIGFYESEEVFNAWLNSPSHKANIVNPNYTEVGTAVLSGFGPENSIVVVQEFASPMPVKTTPVKTTGVKPAPIASKPANTNIAVPAPKPEESAPITEKVLSQTTQVIESPRTSNVAKVTSKVVNSLLYDYDNVLQNITFGVSLLVIGVLLTLIFFNFKLTYKKELVFRSVLIVILLSLATVLNKELILSLIPHQILI